MGDFVYYNGASLLNADCPINFCIGNRSIGKSYYWKRYLFKQYVEKGKKFIYLRRHVNDIDMSAPTWFDDIGNVYPNYNVEFKGNIFYAKNLDIDTVDICGYAFALSMIHKLKSVPMEDVDFIFFDEFIPENLQYLKPLDPTYEPKLLLSVYLTVARGYKRPIRDEVKIICAANLITLYNPYFSFFSITIKPSKKQYNKIVYNNVYVEIVTLEETANLIRESKIGKVLENTSYGDYALSNVPLLDVESNIKKRPQRCRVFFEIYLYKWYICYFDDYGNNYIAPGFDQNVKLKYKVTDVEGDNILWFKGDIVRTMRKCVENNKLFYHDMETKSALMGLLTPRVGGL